MATAAYNKFTPAIEGLMEAINSQADTWKIALATAVSQADGTFTEVANGNGYTTGGNQATVASSSQSGGTYKLVLNSPNMWTASGSGFSFQYAVLVNSTNNLPVAYWDYGSSQVVGSGENVTVTLDSTNGVFQVT